MKPPTILNKELMMRLSALFQEMENIRELIGNHNSNEKCEYGHDAFDILIDDTIRFEKDIVWLYHKICKKYYPRKLKKPFFIGHYKLW